MAGYYYKSLSKQQKAVYDALRQGFDALAPAIRVERLENAELSDVYQRLKLDEPGLWFVVGFTYRFYPQASHVELVPEYLFDKQKIREHRQAVESRIARLTRPLQGKSPREKAVAIHDFILENVRYDKLKKSYSHEIIGPLTQGVGVCEGIAKTVKALCDECGVECIVALSHDNPDRGVKYRHAWNVVKLEGKWYHVDATFDNSLQRGVKRYDYFGLDDKRIFRDHERLVLPLPACSDGDSFHYRTISLTKLEQVESRVKQALRKKEPHFVFHWRGGGLNRAILREILAFGAVVIVAAEEGTHGLAAADNFQTLAEDLGRQNFHGGVVQISGNIVGTDTGSVDLLKEIDGHTQVYIAHALDGQADAVFAGIELAILASAVILKQQQAVAVGQLINILGLAGVQQFEIFHNFVTSF